MPMAKATNENGFIKLATRMGLQKMLSDVNELLQNDLTEAQRIANQEMKQQIEKHLEELAK
jgi:hypothetical protein